MALFHLWAPLGIGPDNYIPIGPAYGRSIRSAGRLIFRLALWWNNQQNMHYFGQLLPPFTNILRSGFGQSQTF
jgi:hypothetical protein